MKPETSFALHYLRIGDVAPGWGAVDDSKGGNFFWKEDDRRVERIVRTFMLRPVGVRWSDASLRLSNIPDIIERRSDQIGHRSPNGAWYALDNIPNAILHLV